MNMRVGSYCCMCGEKYEACKCYNNLTVTVSGDTRWLTPVEPQPHKCPVCDGSGEVKQTTYTSTSAGLMENHATHTTVNCHGCDGRGWVTI